MTPYAEEKELPRPTIAHMLYEFLPLIDEHNKARQNALALEKVWLTKDPWFRIMTTLLGMAVVDLQRFDRNKRDTHAGTTLMLDDEVTDFDIRMMANLISKPLTSGKFKFRETSQPSARGTSDDNKLITRITGDDGSITYPPSKPGKAPRSRTGKCFICRQYIDGGRTTNWKCRECGMPICQLSRSDNVCRTMSCVEEHKCSSNEYIGCGKMQRTTFISPPSLGKYKELRSSAAARASRKRSSDVTPSPTKRSKRGRQR